MKQRCKIMKFRLSKEKEYPANGPCTWFTAMNQGQGASLGTQFKDNNNELPILTNSPHLPALCAY